MFHITFINQKGQRVNKIFDNYPLWERTLIRMRYSKVIKVTAYGKVGV